jgi:hypothetical protein
VVLGLEGAVVFGPVVLGDVVGEVVLGEVVEGVLVEGAVSVGWVVDAVSFGAALSEVAAFATRAAPTAEPAAIPSPATTRSARRVAGALGGGPAAQGFLPVRSPYP